LRHGCEIWVEALEKTRNLDLKNIVHRLAALRVASAYRTVSYDAACVVSGMIPIKILLMEDKLCWIDKQNNGDPNRAQHRENSVRQWQEHLDTSTKGRWTHTVIPLIISWLEGPHGEVDYFVTHISAVSLTEYMCESKNIWERVAKYMKYTLTTLEVDRQEVIID
jgi:hypothetical protein